MQRAFTKGRGRHTSWNEELSLGLWEGNVGLRCGEDDLHLRNVTHFDGFQYLNSKARMFGLCGRSPAPTVDFLLNGGILKQRQKFLSWLRFHQCRSKFFVEKLSALRKFDPTAGNATATVQPIATQQNARLMNSDFLHFCLIHS